MGGARQEGVSPPMLMLMRAGAVNSDALRGTERLQPRWHPNVSHQGLLATDITAAFPAPLTDLANVDSCSAAARLGIISKAFVTLPADTSTPVLMVMTLRPLVSCTGMPHPAPCASHEARRSAWQGTSGSQVAAHCKLSAPGSM